MELRQLEYFLAVVEHGGVTKAATALRVPQPTLSDAIRALEREAGVALFHRVSRGVVPTSAGVALQGPARRALRERTVALALVQDREGSVGGRLDIVAWSVVSVSPLAHYIAAFRRQHPRVTVHVADLPDQGDPVAMLRDGRHEIAVAYLPVHGHGIIVHELGEHEFSVVFPPGTTRSLPDPVPTGMLDDLPACSVPRTGPMGIPIEDALIAGGGRTREAAITAHRDAQVPLVRAGVGIAFASPARAEQSVRFGLTVRRLDPAVRRTYGLLHADMELSPAARAFTDFTLRLASAERAQGRA
jgi:DNA-binding transcriptional LysR family regulator